MRLFQIVFLLFITSCSTSRIVLVTKDLTMDDAWSSKVTKVKNNSASFYIEKFEDKRVIKKMVGEARTGMFNGRTPISLDKPVGQFIQESLIDGLNKRKIKVENKDKANFTLRGKIKEFWVRESTDGWSPEFSICNFKLDIAVFSNITPGEYWYGIVVGENSSKTPSLDTTYKNGNILKSCINSFLEELIHSEEFQQFTSIRVVKKKSVEK